MNLSQSIEKQLEGFDDEFGFIFTDSGYIESGSVDNACYKEDVKDFFRAAAKQAILDIVPEELELEFDNDDYTAGKNYCRRELLNRINN
jgi:hypothetical protein